MKITLGITTYNRRDYLEKSVKSLLLVNGIEDCNIRVYDDCSADYDIEHLQKLIPSAKQIIRREENIGADRNMAQMYRDFLETGDDILLTCDSDQIYNPEVIKIINKYIENTDGILSLYNSKSHKSEDDLIIDNMLFLSKKILGSAGTVFKRGIIEQICKNIPLSESYDWKWSEYLRESCGLTLLCLHQSYIQHIGIKGTNNNIYYFDYGLNFRSGNEYNVQIVSELAEYMIINAQKIAVDAQKVLENKWYRFGQLSSSKKIIFILNYLWRRINILNKIK